ncbi:MAG: SGNH/GDSL hydrolase family protein, partial [Candidatus Neomarinimicrobiota bacterium]
MTASSHSLRQLLIRLGLLVLSPLIVFGLLELVLRLIDFGPDLALFVPYGDTGQYLTPNRDVSLRYFSRAEMSGFSSESFFLKEKGDSTLRIFALGGSTTASFPYYFNGTFPALLRDRLVQAYPEYKVELVNLGMTAVTSFTILDFTRDLLTYGPDLLLVYMGHNEFYGVLGSASTQGIGSSRALTVGYQRLRRLKVFQLLRLIVW